jgi:predicted AAA+ superfamily ATPase
VRIDIRHLFSFCLNSESDTVFVVTGPRGTGKSELVQDAAKNEPYKLVINCDELVNQVI